MTDDLDDLLRRAMKTLDDQVPAGYFEALPQQLVTRLGADDTMQPTETGDSDRQQPGNPAAAREEDSGLHDIRSLASEQRQRLTKRSSQNPILTDDEILASSSAGWKAAVALPEPAKMVSLPDLPEPEAPKPAERASKPKLERASKEKIAVAPAAAPVASAAPQASVTQITAKVVRTKQGGGRGAFYAVTASALAIAAGAALFITTRNKAADSSSVERAAGQPAAMQAPAQSDPAAAPAAPPPVVEAAAQIASDVTPDAGAAATGMAAGSGAAIESPPAPGGSGDPDTKVAPAAKQEPPGKPDGKSKVSPGKRIETKDGGKLEKTTKPAPEVPVPSPKKPVKSPDAEESLEDLLKEAGADTKKEPAKPALDKKSLSGDDMKKGMQGVAGKAQGCYAGTQGTANVKLVVAPTGRVQKVTVTGAFAGTAVGNCVEAAVKAATFPPWDGPPQSFGFSYLLSE